MSTLRAYELPEVAAGVRPLHLNEFRFEHHPDVLDAYSAAADPDVALTRYSTGPSAELVAAVSGYTRAARDCVLIAAGSDEVLRAIVDTSPARGHARVIEAKPGYTHFSQFCAVRGMETVSYQIGVETSPEDHLAALEYHAEMMAEGCLVYLGSPNNPTGDIWSPKTIGMLADKYPASLFLVDNAYEEFANPMGLLHLSAVSVAHKHPNVVAVCTLSKCFGLAAIRVGYAVASPALVRSIGVAVSPKAFSVSASAIAVAALKNAEYYLECAARAAANRDAAVKALQDQGWWARTTPGNFLNVHVGDAGRALKVLAENGVLVRSRHELPGMSGFVRVTAGNEDDTVAVVRAFSALKATIPPAAPAQRLYTNKGTVAAVKGLLKRAVAVLRDAGVAHWAQSGTMLGMLRHGALHPDGSWRGGMIPTDDDADIAYLRSGAHDALAGLAPSFAAAGLTLQRNRTDAYWQVGTNAPGQRISPVHVDVFSYAGTPQTGYQLDDVRFRDEDPSSAQAHCNTRYSHDELFPLNERCWFYDVPLAMPAKSEQVLCRSLGPDFMQVMRVRTPDGLVEVRLSDYSPA